jgi:hypothetical protein
MAANCPHCDAPAAPNSSFCTSCGKAVPGGAPTGPRILGNNDFATSSAGTSLMIDELARQTRKAFSALLAVGIVQVIFTGIMAAQAQTQSQATSMTVMLGGIAAVFLGLAFWARKAPLPAAVVGLVIYVSLWALDAIAEVAAGHPEQMFRGILIKGIIVACLARAIASGVKHRAISQQAENPGANTSANTQSYSQAA